MAIWMLMNVLHPFGWNFDPYPFILLNLALSTIAAIQAPLIMMSQNRAADYDRLQARNDFNVNMESEREIRLLHTKIDHMVQQDQTDLLEIQRLQTELLVSLSNQVTQLRQEMNQAKEEVDWSIIYPDKENGETMTSLLKYFKGYLWETFLGPVFKLLEAIFELCVPLIIAHLVDQVIPKKETSAVVMTVGVLFLFASFGVVVAITAQYFSSKAAVGFTREMTKDLYDKILSLPKDKRDRIGTSSLVTRLTSDTYQIQVGINLFLRLFLRAPIIVFGAIIMAFTISPKLTLWFLGMVAILTLIIVIMSRIVNPLFAKIRKITDRMVTVTRQQFQGMRVIRAFGQQASELEDFREVNQDYKVWQIRAGILSSLVSPLTFLVVNTTLVCVIWQGQLTISAGLLSQGM